MTTTTTLIIATRNRHKVQEIRTILGGSFRYLTLDDLPGAPAVVEDADTFAGNAAKKAVALARWVADQGPASLTHSTSTIYVIADDSGLEVDALDGAPGVHSARYAALDHNFGLASEAGNSPDAQNNAKLLRLLQHVPLEKRIARFRCVIALAEVPKDTSSPSPGTSAEVPLIQPEPRLFEGACEGRLSFTPAGGGGFGYDPLFVPVGFTQSFAELGEAVKNRLSHRGRALAQLHAWMRKQLEKKR